MNSNLVNKMTCKAFDISDVDTLSSKTLSKRDYKSILNLPEYDANEVIDLNNLMSDLPADLPQWFLVRTWNRTYIINTEGSSYARYIVELVS